MLGQKLNKFYYFPGYYCPGGSDVATDVICPIGMHCPEGSSEPHDCMAGMYTDYEGASECHICPEGFYCVPELVIPGIVSTVTWPCPQGFFCPNGTGHDWQPCPAGSYGNSLGLAEALECTPCDGGYYCAGKSKMM